MTVRCDYCRSEAVKVTGVWVYPHRPDLYDKTFYMCEPCGAWVGCHSISGEPLGRLANADLRKLKSETHKVFDKIWQSGEMSRTQAYEWLSQALGVRKRYCHIGNFDERLCMKVIEVCRRRNDEARER